MNSLWQCLSFAKKDFVTSSSDQTMNLESTCFHQVSLLILHNICFDFFNWEKGQLFSFSTEKYWWKQLEKTRFLVWSDEPITCLFTSHQYLTNVQCCYRRYDCQTIHPQKSLLQWICCKCLAWWHRIKKNQPPSSEK